MKRILLLCFALIAALTTRAQLMVSFMNPTDGQTVTAPLVLRVSIPLMRTGNYVVSVEYFANGESIGVVSNQLLAVPGFPVDPTNPIVPIVPITPIQTNPVIVGPTAQAEIPQRERRWRPGSRWNTEPHPGYPIYPQPPPIIIPIQPGPIPIPIPIPILWPFSLYWNPAPGNYTLTAVATDNEGNTAKADPVTVKVIEIPVVTVMATQPIASPGNPGHFTISRTGDTSTDLSLWIYLRGNAQNGVDYTSVSNQVTIPAGSSAVDVIINGLKFSPVTSKIVTLALTGLAIPLDSPSVEEAWPLFVWYNPPYIVGTPSSANVYIKAHPRMQHVPSVTLLWPREGLTFPTGTNILLTAEAMDPDTYVSKVDFFDGVTPIGEKTNAFLTYPGAPLSFQIVWTNAPMGNHLLRARATDSQGMTQISAPVSIQVVPVGVGK